MSSFGDYLRNTHSTVITVHNKNLQTWTYRENVYTYWGGQGKYNSVFSAEQCFRLHWGKTLGSYVDWEIIKQKMVHVKIHGRGVRGKLGQQTTNSLVTFPWRPGNDIDPWPETSELGLVNSFSFWWISLQGQRLECILAKRHNVQL